MVDIITDTNNNDSLCFVMPYQVEDLAVASPATVSRCGMVYNDGVDLGTQPFIDSWLEKKDKGKIDPPPISTWST